MDDGQPEGGSRATSPCGTPAAAPPSARSARPPVAATATEPRTTHPGAKEPEPAWHLPEGGSALTGRQILARTLGGLAVLLALLGVVAWAFHEPLERLSAWFVETLGGAGVFLGFLLPDAAPLPLPHDAFSTFGWLGGLPFWDVVAWASSGSLIGGSIGWWIGGRLSHTTPYRRFMATRGREVDLLLRRYGAMGLVIGAVTPLPFAISCWAGGAAGVRYPMFLAIALLRIPRIAFYLWLLGTGLRAAHS